MSIEQIVKLKMEVGRLSKENDSLREKVAAADRRDAIEKELLGINANRQSPMHLRTIDAQDFVEKRAMLEKSSVGIEIIKTAAQLAGNENFSLGDEDSVETSQRFASTGSKANDDFANAFFGNQ